MELEARVRARVADEKRQAERALREANITFQRAIDAHTRAGRRYELCASKVSQRRAEGKPITAKMQEELDALHGALIRSYERRIRARNKRDELGARVRVLGSKDEINRRIELSRRLERRVGEKLPIGKEACELVLLQAGRPLHYKEITRLALESGLIKTKGKTPKQTISSYLTRAVKDGDTFVRIEPGVFGLKDRDEVAV